MSRELTQVADTKFELCHDVERVLKIGRDFQKQDTWRGAHHDTAKLLCDTIEYLRDRLNTPAGNMAAMRDALMNIAAYAQSAECHTEDSHVLGYLNQVRAWVNSALAEPPRQCDVGNAKEQYKRFYEMCFNRSCTLCHYKFYEGCSRDQCFARWEQTLYEKGGAV